MGGGGWGLGLPNRLTVTLSERVLENFHIRKMHACQPVPDLPTEPCDIECGRPAAGRH